MRCLLVGSGGMTPLPDRFLNVLLVQVKGSAYLFDCGEGTQIAMKRWHAGFRKIALLAITHLHGDHVLGIPGFLMARANAGATDVLTIVGPPGIRRLVQDVTAAVGFVPPYPTEYMQIDPESWTPETAGRARPREVYRDERVRLEAAPLEHAAPCLGYRLLEHDRPGKFDAQRARRLNIPQGPLWRRLQDGHAVESEGRTIEPQEVVGPPRRGRVCAMITDTLPCPGAYRLLEDADIAFLEGMFMERDREAAGGRTHLTIGKAARMAAEQRVLRTVLTHLSPRYTTDDLDLLEGEARAINPAAEIGRDGTRYEVALRDR